MILPRTRRKLIESSQDDDNEEDNDATEEQVVPQIANFTTDLEILMTNINNSVSRRGLKVSLDGRRLESYDEALLIDNDGKQIELSSEQLVDGPFTTEDYFDSIGQEPDPSVVDKDVISLVKKCAASFCDAYKCQEQIEDLQARIKALRDKQVKVWVECKKIIMEKYPHDFLRLEDKELFFNTALIGKDFIPNLIQARALKQLIEYHPTLTDEARAVNLTGFYGFSRDELLRKHGLVDDESLTDQVKTKLTALTATLKKNINLLKIGSLMLNNLSMLEHSIS